MLKKSIFAFAMVLLTEGLIYSTSPDANTLTTYPAAPGMTANNDFTVRLRTPEAEWQNLYEYNVKVNYYNVSNASMLCFSFSGTVEMEIVYNSGMINSFEIRPGSFGIQAVRKGNKLTLNVTQYPSFPRKFVVIINGDLFHCLHILGNPPENNPPLVTDSNVWPVDPGETLVPLPEGKDTYYFKPGIHQASDISGEWAELDLKKTYRIGKIELVQKDFAHKFKVYGRNSLTDKYKLVYDGTGNTAGETITRSFKTAGCRYVKIQFFENTANQNICSNRIKEFKIYEAGRSINLALKKFRIGSHEELIKIADGDENTAYETNRGAGRIWLYSNGQKIYIPGSAVVQCGIWGLGLFDIVIRGRGIIDGSNLFHSFPNDEVNRVMPFINFSQGANITYEGFILIDHPGWGMFVIGSPNSKIQNVSTISWAPNSDGICLDGANGSVLRGCFIRTSDDIIITHSGENILVENSVFWGDKAHIFFMGNHGVFKRSQFRNIDIIGSYESLPEYQGVMALHSSNGGSVEDVTFEDIRIAPFRDPVGSVVFSVHMNNRTDWELKPGKSVRNITFRNICYYGTGESASIVQGADSTRFVDGINFINYRRQGVLVTNSESGNIKIGEEVYHVDFK